MVEDFEGRVGFKGFYYARQVGDFSVKEHYYLPDEMVLCAFDVELGSALAVYGKVDQRGVLMKENPTEIIESYHIGSCDCVLCCRLMFLCKIFFNKIVNL